MKEGRENDQVDHKSPVKGVLHQGRVCQGENTAEKLGESEGDLRRAGRYIQSVRRGAWALIGATGGGAGDH